jgi:hypothetical protein
MDGLNCQELMGEVHFYILSYTQFTTDAFGFKTIQIVRIMGRDKYRHCEFQVFVK